MPSTSALMTDLRTSSSPGTGGEGQRRHLSLALASILQMRGRALFFHAYVLRLAHAYPTSPLPLLPPSKAFSPPPLFSPNRVSSTVLPRHGAGLTFPSAAVGQLVKGRISSPNAAGGLDWGSGCYMCFYIQQKDNS